MSWNKYHRYKTIDDFVKCLAQEYPDKAQIFEIGSSYERRKMHLLRITNNLRVNKKAVWIDGGIHAREWASPSAVTYLMNEFLQNSQNYKEILDRYDIFILPLANPDGYIAFFYCILMSYIYRTHAMATRGYNSFSPLFVMKL